MKFEEIEKVRKCKCCNRDIKLYEYGLCNICREEQSTAERAIRCAEEINDGGEFDENGFIRYFFTYGRQDDSDWKEFIKHAIEEKFERMIREDEYIRKLADFWAIDYMNHPRGNEWLFNEIDKIKENKKWEQQNKKKV